MDFSKVIKDALNDQKKNIMWLSEKMGCSYQYLWRLINKKKGRWNEDSINKACGILGIEIQFKNRSA